MKIKNLPIEFNEATKVLRTIEDAGFEAYFVGGSVRDTLLGLPIHDVDIATSAYPNEIKDIFRRTVDTGIKHGTVTVMIENEGFEVTTFRTDSGYQDYRRPDEVKFVRSLKEDLQRRDFTINALAMKKNGEIIDLFNGLDDLNNHLIRAVGIPDERFNEDALRMMRAVRFASQLNFAIEEPTFEAIRKHSKLLTKIAIERVHEEFVKMMLGIDPNRGLEQMMETGLMDEVPILSEYQQQLHKLVSVDIHDHINNEIQVWALLDKQLDFDRPQIGQELKNWKCSNDLIRNVQNTVFGINCLMGNQLTDENLYQLSLSNLINAVKVANVFGKFGKIYPYQVRYENLPIKSKKDLKLNGSKLMELGVPAGPRIGKVLDKLEIAVVKQQVDNTKDALTELVKKLRQQNGVQN